MRQRAAARLRVDVVGFGRAPAVLGAASRRVGHTVVAVNAVGDPPSTRAERLLPGGPVRGRPAGANGRVKTPT